jgi:ABC-type nitrate/sulfonate/bicarbonate transport system substrate-binding protein/nitrogen-specific signal transduction histidine kinase
MRRTTPILLALCQLLLITPASALEKVRLQLKWSHQFQFAGYYAAKQLGYYRDAGLDVEINAAQPGIDAIEVVRSQEAEYGVANSGILLSRNAGAPVVVLAVIMQHSPFVLITRKEATIDGIQGLAGKRLMLEPLADEIIAYLNHKGLPLSSFAQVSVDLHDLEPFINGEVDAIDAYSTDEPYELMNRGVPFNLFNPRTAGIDFYGDNLFTTEQELENHPQRVRKFRAASLRGWRYAMAHQEEVAEMILANYPTAMDHDYLIYEAQQMQQLMLPELIDVGYMLEKRWRHIADTYASLGMLPQNISLDGFLYEEDPQYNYYWFFAALVITLSILTLVALVAIRFFKLNSQLKRLLHVQTQFANIGESVNNISHQWKQPLNELGIQLMRIEQLAAGGDTVDEKQAEISRIAAKGHDVLEFMAKTADAFGHVLNTSQKSTDFNPDTIIQELLYLLRDSFAVRDITIHYSQGANATLHGNSTEFAHVVLSILNNARDIIAERQVALAQISIDTHSADGRFCLDITDNAGGIHTTPVEHIFALGFSEKKGMDSGVGLFMARRIVEDNFHGTITAQNSARGARFRITLPCR